MKKYIDRDRLVDYAYLHSGGLTVSDIMSFPTVDVQSDNDWISVEDRLPKPGIPVLALQLDVPHQRAKYRLV